MPDVTEDEAQLVRAHREAGRLAAALVTDPFDPDTVTRLEGYLRQAQEAAAVYGALRERGPGLLRRIARLSQVAVDARPGGGAP